MEFLNNEDLLTNILYYLDIKDIEILLTVTPTIITKYYQNNGIHLTLMPIFTPCHDIVLYLKHYHSFISGSNFPDQPLWLFSGKMIRNYFDRPAFLTYHTNYQYNEFIDATTHWKRLTEQQKYLFWCAITGTHPEIDLKKELGCPDLVILISKAYWYYPHSFVRYYLEIYFVGDDNLWNVKRIAQSEIEAELKIYSGETFYTSNNLIDIFDSVSQERFAELFENEQINMFMNTFGINNKEDIVKMLRKITSKDLENAMNNMQNVQGVMLPGFDNIEMIGDIYKNKTYPQQTNEQEIEALKIVIKEIEELEIERPFDLKTTNVNYHRHMKTNYGFDDFHQMIYKNFFGKIDEINSTEII